MPLHKIKRLKIMGAIHPLQSRHPTKKRFGLNMVLNSRNRDSQFQELRMVPPFGAPPTATPPGPFFLRKIWPLSFGGQIKIWGFIFIPDPKSIPTGLPLNPLSLLSPSPWSIATSTT